MTALPPGSWLPADDPQLAALDDLDPDDESTVVWVKDGRLIIGEDDEEDDMGDRLPARCRSKREIGEGT